MNVYLTNIHSFDMNDPDIDISVQAIQRFNERLENAMEHYFAKQTN